MINFIFFNIQTTISLQQSIINIKSINHQINNSNKSTAQTSRKKQQNIKMPHYWLAIFFGYNGHGYNGMQHQKQQHVVSVENQIIPLLFNAGFLPTDNYTQLQRKYKYSRAARTDKGVHAVINGFSCEFNVDKRYIDEDGTLNKQRFHLDLKQAFEKTKVVYHCFKRVTTRFQMRQLIQSRKYSYICPLKYFHQQGKTVEEIVEKLNKCGQQYVGTHNFHNYSRDLKAKDPQAKRYILSFHARLFGPQQNFIKFSIHGQSFVYNQIRKMIGGIVFVFINNYPAQFIGNTFFRNQFYLPIAPAQGLYLKSVDFKGYNNKKQIPQKLQFQEEHIKKTTQELQKQIQEFIQKTDEEIWNNWYDQVKEGKIIIPDDDYRGETQKGEGA